MPIRLSYSLVILIYTYDLNKTNIFHKLSPIDPSLLLYYIFYLIYLISHGPQGNRKVCETFLKFTRVNICNLQPKIA